MNSIAGYLAGAWVVPEFCLALSGLLLGTGLGLLAKGWFHQRRKKALMKLAGIGNKPGSGKKTIPASMTMGKKLWNPSVFYFCGLLACAMAGVVFWPGLGRTDYLRIQEFSALIIWLAGFLVSMSLVMLWSPAGMIPFLAFAALSLVLQLTDPGSPALSLYACHETPQTRLVPDPDENPLLSVEYLPGQSGGGAGTVGSGTLVTGTTESAGTGTDGAGTVGVQVDSRAVWRITALSPMGKEILGSAYRSLAALPDQDLTLDFVYLELPVFLRPFASPLKVELELIGIDPGTVKDTKMPRSRGLWQKAGNLEIKLSKVVSPKEGTVIYLGGATKVMDLRLLPEQ